MVTGSKRQPSRKHRVVADSSRAAWVLIAAVTLIVAIGMVGIPAGESDDYRAPAGASATCDKRVLSAGDAWCHRDETLEA